MLLFRNTLIFYKQPVYKQLAFGWQIAKHFNCKIAVKLAIHQISDVSKALFGKF